MFQSTLPHGERPGLWPVGAEGALFQSTLPHGERRANCRTISPLGVFQSTLPHGERREQQQQRVERQSVSIHAPTRGATYVFYCLLLELKSFNPRSHTGSDCSQAASLPTRMQFQSTLPHGERRFGFGRRGPRRGFNPRSHTGSDGLCGPSLQAISSFNPRSHTGSDRRLCWAC